MDPMMGPPPPSQGTPIEPKYRKYIIQGTEFDLF